VHVVGQHFLVTEEHYEVPPLQLAFSNTCLLNSLRRFEEYFDGMRAVAKQKMQTRLVFYCMFKILLVSVLREI
jgi:hypothetical protein